MKNKFIEYNEKNKLFNDNDRILLGVSGGIDSIVMLDIFFNLGIEIGIAHFNFKLRGNDSEKDEAFVRNLAKKYEVPFFCKSANTSLEAKNESVSIQMKARDLRYTWFCSLCKEESYDYIAVAHNSDDNVETFLLNITRGTGILGLTGIPFKRDRIIRPLLFSSREMIVNYCENHKLNFRQDKSNNSTKYSRNKLRHIVIPSFNEINPSFKKTVSQNIERLSEVYIIYKNTILEKEKKLVKIKDNALFIDIDGLIKTKTPTTYLYEFLKKYSFTEILCKEILTSLQNSGQGKKFLTNTHRAIIDRDYIIVLDNNKSLNNEYYIQKDDSEVDIPINISMEQIFTDENFNIPRTKSIACIDKDKLVFPLKIRKYKQSDRFNPLGMNGSKKISDFFINKKFSIIEKEQTWLLISGNDIIWVIGYRIDDRYKYTKDTKNVILFKL